MNKPQLIFVAGCNAAGKSTFIRSRLNELEDFIVLMTDVYKSRTKELAKRAISQGGNIIIFNDKSFSELVDIAREAGYHTSLILLFLDTPAQSVSRIAFRVVQQNGINISGGNIKINFNESFRNATYYFLYFDRSDFIYTGLSGHNSLIMSFKKGLIVYYKTNKLQYPQKFAHYARSNRRLNQKDYDTIIANLNIADESTNLSKFKL